MDILAEPVGEELFFAGEGTYSRVFGTTHAAFFSGERAASEVLASHAL